MSLVLNHFDKLPLELSEFIHNIVHKEHMKAVCQELHSVVEDHNGLPLFTTLSYEGFRPFNLSFSGAREVAVYMGDCWHPYLIRWSDDGSNSDSSTDDDNWSEISRDEFWGGVGQGSAPYGEYHDNDE
tara:strand:- start:116 stop:499 length:384 start_codon:yes stop_codon:yes gene_type:complete